MDTPIKCIHYFYTQFCTVKRFIILHLFPTYFL